MEGRGMPRLSRSVVGFTLLELLTTLAFVSVVALLGYPNLQRMMVRSKLRGSAEELAALLREARLEAVKNNSTVVLKVHGSVADAEGGAREAFLFVDRNDDAVYDPPAGALTNDGTKLPGSFSLPSDALTPHAVL